MKTFLNIISTLLMKIVGLVGGLLAWFIERVADTFQYNNFLNSEAVQIGWPLVRDLCNISVVVILLIIAFGTILKISAYHYKTTLLKLVIMAILINFSKTITGLLIDIGQVAMMTFVNGFKGAILINLKSGFGIDNMLTMVKTAEPKEVFGAVLLALILLVVACFTMAAYLVVLLFRILTLWILIILSPIAFIAYAFPNLKKYWSDFWAHLFKEITLGIVLAFLMWLSLTILALSTTNKGEVLNQFSQNQSTSSDSSTATVITQSIEFDGQEKELSLSASKISTTPELFTFIVSIALLWLGLSYAQKASGVAGQIAGKIGGKLSDIGMKTLGGAYKAVTSPLRGLGFIAKTGIKRSAGYLERKMLLEPSAAAGAGRFRKGLKYLTKAGWEGFAKRGDTLLDNARTVASAEAHDEANSFFTGGHLQTSHQEAADEKIAKDSADEMGISGLQDLKAKFGKALKMGNNTEKDTVIRGLFAVASKVNWVDDLMAIPKVARSLMDEGSEEQKKYDFLIKQEKSFDSDFNKELEGEKINPETGEAYTEADRKGYKEGRMLETTREYDTKRKKELRGELTIKYIAEGKSGEALEQAVAMDMDKHSKTLSGKGGKTALDHVEIIDRKKTGKFLEQYIARDHNGDLSQSGLNLAYSHESNAIANGHIEDLGYIRADEETGEKRILDYTRKDKDGLTEADREGLIEATKQGNLDKLQAHSYGARYGDGTNGSADEHVFYTKILSAASQSNEAFRLGVLARTANVLTGGTALKSLVGKTDKESVKSINFDALSDLRTFLSSLEIGQGMAVKSFYQGGGEYISEGGQAMEIRDGSKEGYMLTQYKDERGDNHKVAISIAEKKVYEVKEKPDDDGNITYKVGNELHRSIKGFAESLGMYINQTALEAPASKASASKKRKKAPEVDSSAPKAGTSETEEGSSSKPAKGGSKDNKDNSEIISALDKLADSLNDANKGAVDKIKTGVNNSNKEQMVKGSISLVLDQAMMATSNIYGDNWKSNSKARIKFANFLLIEIKKMFKDNKKFISLIKSDLNKKLGSINENAEDGEDAQQNLDDFINDIRE